MPNLTERLEFNFHWKDIKVIDSLMQDYISDRVKCYDSIFCDNENDISLTDITQYLHYFTQYDFEYDYKVHPYLERLNNFLNRNYEIFSIPTLYEKLPIIQGLLSPIELSVNYDTIMEISDWEYNIIEQLKETWDIIINELLNFPLLNLDKMEYEELNGVQVYYDKDIDRNVAEPFKDFVNDIYNTFPNTLLRLDSFLLLDPEYIELVAGEGTKAYYLEDSIFFAKEIKDKDREGEELFTVQSYYHEFAHFIYAQLSETYINYWIDNYEDWTEKEIKMTRDKDRNVQLDCFCEELFCDTFACMFIDTPNTEEYIHNPSQIITDTVDFILRQEFN